MTQILKAFIARSFLPEDERRLRPTLDFLETFRSIGFVCQSAEPAEVESVSEKVRRIIDESDVFIGFFTKRHPVYELKPGIRGALDLALGKLRPKFWSAPAWVLQESGYALKSLSLRKLILLREPDVEVFGLQGDLEYIPFVPERFAEAQAKLNEMILGLVAEAAGTEVKLVLSQREDRKLEAAVATTQDDKGQGAEPQQPKNEAAAPELFDHYFAMLSASRAKDLRSLEEAWKYGVRLIEEGRARDVDVVRWESWYQGFRFDAGAADALEALRGLQAKNPTREEPVSAVAECLYKSKEYEQSSELFLKASELSAPKAWYLLKAAESFRELKRYEPGISAATAALSDARGQTKTDAISVLYQLLRESGQAELAYGVAELALQENPRLGIRFNTALDYHRDNIANMALHHFKFLYDSDKNDTSSLHNIAAHLCRFEDADHRSQSVQRSVRPRRNALGRQPGIYVPRLRHGKRGEGNYREGDANRGSRGARREMSCRDHATRAGRGEKRVGPAGVRNRRQENADPNRKSLPRTASAGGRSLEVRLRRDRPSAEGRSRCGLCADQNSGEQLRGGAAWRGVSSGGKD